MFTHRRQNSLNCPSPWQIEEDRNVGDCVLSQTRKQNYKQSQCAQKIGFIQEFEKQQSSEKLKLREIKQKNNVNSLRQQLLKVVRHKNIKEKYEQGTGYSRLKMPFIYPVSIHVRLSHSLIIGAQRKKMSKLKEKRMETEQINCGAKFHNVSDDESSLQKQIGAKCYKNRCKTIQSPKLSMLGKKYRLNEEREKESLIRKRSIQKVNRSTPLSQFLREQRETVIQRVLKQLKCTIQ